jgi:hypothetical protein
MIGMQKPAVPTRGDLVQRSGPAGAAGMPGAAPGAPGGRAGQPRVGPDPALRYGIPGQDQEARVPLAYCRGPGYLRLD